MSFKQMIEDLEKMTKIEFWTAPESIRASLEGKVRQAKKDLEYAKMKAAEDLMARSYMVCFSEKINKDEFLKEVEIPNNYVVLDMMDLENKLFEACFKSKKVFVINGPFLSSLNKALIDIMNQFNPPVSWADSIKLNSARYRTLKTKEEAIEFINLLLKETYGGSAKSLFLTNEIRNAMVKNIHAYLDSLSVCLLNCKQEEVEALGLNCDFIKKVNKSSLKNVLKSKNNKE